MSFAALTIIVVLIAILLAQHYYHAQQVEEADKSADRWRNAYYRADRHSDEMFYRALDYKERLRRATERISAGTGYEKCGTGCLAQSERCAFSQECASE